MDDKSGFQINDCWECVYCGMKDPSEATFVSFNMNKPKGDRGQVGMVYWTCDFCKETRWNDDPKPIEILSAALKAIQDEHAPPTAT